MGCSAWGAPRTTGQSLFGILLGVGIWGEELLALDADRRLALDPPNHARAFLIPDAKGGRSSTTNPLQARLMGYWQGRLVRVGESRAEVVQKYS